MSIISLIKLIAIGAGMFFYYRLIDENDGYYISIPVIGAFVVLLGMSLTLDEVAAIIFLFMLQIFLYFIFTFMAQIDTIISISYLVINLLADMGSRFGLFGPSVSIIVLVISSVIYWLLQYIDIDFVISILKWGFFSTVLGVIWTMAHEKFLLYLNANFSTLPI